MSRTGQGDGGPALFRLVRFWGRRWAGQASAQETAPVQRILVVEAAHANDDATIASVARQLGLDHSGASRMVRDAEADGYLVRVTSPDDRRRVAVRLTPAGHELLAASQRWQREVFAKLTQAWAERDQRQFAAYLQRLADELEV
jgi:DNA-binding MarR family transcriptional regulator